MKVSVEPPPKQGCEPPNILQMAEQAMSQWNPRRSRGARIGFSGLILGGAMSQWNPRRSRGASRL